MFKVIPFLLLLLAVQATAFAAGGEDLIQRYRLESGQEPSVVRGEALWNRQVRHSSGEAVRSCVACHGHDLTQPGRHMRTGKAIPPMARSARPDALTDEAKVQKWLKRNCKWTLGRECTALEKSDVLSFLLKGKWI